MQDDKISIVEMFVALQGEGRNIGIPYAFIRVGGCPLRCNFCDSEYTFQPKPESIVSVDGVVEWAINQKVKWVSITGGEPLIYIPQLQSMLYDLRECGMLTHVETSGRYYDADCHRLSTIWSPDAKTPCTGEQDDKWREWIGLLRQHDQVKCLIKDKTDLDYALKVNQAMPLKGTEMILQPFNQLVDETDIDPEVGKAIFQEWKSYELIKQTKQLAEMFLEDSSKRHWHNVRITPQLHVLMYGNQQGK